MFYAGEDHGNELSGGFIFIERLSVKSRTVNVYVWSHNMTKQAQ